MIKEGLQESKDYIICTKSSYEYLNSIYSHKLPEIIRYSIPINENDSIIEVTLKTLNLVIYPPISLTKGLDRALVVSHNETIKIVIDIIKYNLTPYFDSASFDRVTIRL